MVNKRLTFSIMKRTVALVHPSAAHPFRQNLPLSIEDETVPQSEPMTDLTFFCASFVSCFIIVFGMIA